MPVTLYQGDCLRVLPSLPENSIDAVITDPPYHLTQLSRGGSARVNDPSTPFGRTKLGDRGFIGLPWDGGDIAFQYETWSLVHKALRPGGFLLSFGGTRTFHRMAAAIEEAGFEIVDTIVWAYGNGMPKVGYIRDRDGSIVRDGWAGSLKPSIELIVLGRRRLEGSIASNMNLHGTGALNIDACRIPVEDDAYVRNCSGDRGHATNRKRDLPFAMGCGTSSELGRWPTNLIHDGSDEVLDVFGSFGDIARFFYCTKAGARDRIIRLIEEITVEWTSGTNVNQVTLRVDTEPSLAKVIGGSGSAGDNEWNTFLSGSITTALFPKVSKCIISTGSSSTIESKTLNSLIRSLTSGSTVDVSYVTENGGNRAANAGNSATSLTFILAETVSLPSASNALSGTQLRISATVKRHSHPTVKPISLLSYLCKLIIPPGGVVLDPFAGSGTTGQAAAEQGFDAILIEREAEYCDDIRHRLALFLDRDIRPD
jgi:DNA modification methylase